MCGLLFIGMLYVEAREVLVVLCGCFVCGFVCVCLYEFSCSKYRLVSDVM